MNAGTKALASLCAAASAATMILLAVPIGFERALERPGIAALSPAIIEGLFTAVLFGLLGAAAMLGLRLSGERVSAGRAPALSLGLGLMLGVAGFAAAFALATIAGVTRPGDLTETGMASLAIGALLVLLQAAVEELYFRGWLQRALVAGWGRPAGIAAASLAFALLHLINAAWSPMDLVNLALAGLAFGLLADRSGGLMLPTAMHFGWSWAETGLFGTAPNPGVGSFGALFNFDLAGVGLWSGSDEGLISSLAASFALAAIIAATLAWPKPRAEVRSIWQRAHQESPEAG